LFRSDLLVSDELCVYVDSYHHEKSVVLGKTGNAHLYCSALMQKLSKYLPSEVPLFDGKCRIETPEAGVHVVTSQLRLLEAMSSTRVAASCRLSTVFCMTGIVAMRLVSQISRKRGKTTITIVSVSTYAAHTMSTWVHDGELQMWFHTVSQFCSMYLCTHGLDGIA
jgi:hypothetical protein